MRACARGAPASVGGVTRGYFYATCRAMHPVSPSSTDEAAPGGGPLRRGEVGEQLWNDWRWQLRNRLTGLAELESFVRLTDEEREGIARAPALFRIGVTPYYASLMDPDHPFCPVRMQVIPTGAEAARTDGEWEDPLGEDALSPAPAIVHRYPD